MSIADPVPALRRLWQEAFGDDAEFLDKFFSHGFSPDRCRFIAQGETITAALYWFDVSCNNQKLAYIYGVATGSAYRNQGLCRRLMEDTRHALAARGYAGILLVPQNPGVIRTYKKMGYTPCTTLREFSCTAAGSPIALRQISQAEYARCRRALLPGDGVIQEGENLDFLASYASFYAGEGFSAAIAIEAGQLLCLELLGDPGAAPRILAGLGCREGTFRTPGPGRDFAMLLPLTADCPRPGYLGFAFD